MINQNNPQSYTNTANVFVWTLVAFLCCAGGIAMFAGIVLPHDYVCNKLTQYSYTGGIDYFTENYYAGLTKRAQLVGGGLLLLAMVMTLFRKAFANFIYQTGINYSKDKRQLYNWLRDGEESPFKRWLFWIIFIVGIMIRLKFINQVIHADEARTYNAYAFRPFWIIISDWTAPNNHIFHSLLVRCCCLAFGKALIVLRLPALVFGVLLLPIVYLFGKKFDNWITGLFLMAFCAAAYSFVSYSAMGRGYSILFFCTYALFISALAITRFPHNNFAWIVASIVSIIGFWTIPTMLYSFIAVWIWMTISRSCAGGDISTRQWWMRVLFFGVIVAVCVAIVYSPAFVATDWSLISDDTTLTETRTWRGVLAGFIRVLHELRLNFTQSFPVPLILCLILFGLVGLTLRYKFLLGPFRPYFFLGILVMAISFVFPFFIQRVVPYARIYIVYYPLVIMVLFMGIAHCCLRFRKRSVILGITVSVGCFTILLGLGVSLILDHTEGYFATGDEVPGAKPVAEYLQAHVSDDEIIVAWCPTPAALVYYFNQNEYRHRVWDIMEHIPEYSPNGVNMWIVVNKAYGHDLKRHLDRISLSEDDVRVINVYHSREIDIFRLLSFKKSK